ncbi:MAG TPA: DMT family transporter [Gemmatimonadaceae bacterium]
MKKAFIALAAAGSLWGTGFLVGKWALEELTVGQLLLYRFIFATLGFAPAIWRGLSRRETRIQRRDFATITIAALFGVPIQFLIQFEGLARTTVSHASLMVGILPVLLAAASAIFMHEKVRVSRWIALLASTVGAGLIAFGASTGEAGTQASLAGDLLVIASLFTAIVWILISQHLMTSGRYSPTNVSAYILGLGTLMLAVWVIAREGMLPIHLSARTWFSIVTIGIVATTVTTYLWNWGLARVPASQAGVFLNLEPVVGTVLGVLILGDLLGAYAIIGGLLVIGAAVFVAASDNHEPSAV